MKNRTLYFILNIGILLLFSRTGWSFRAYATVDDVVGEKTSNGHSITGNDWMTALPSLSTLSSKVDFGVANVSRIRVNYKR